MPKRKRKDEDCSYLERKIRKLEKKLHRRKNKRRSHRSRTPRSRSHSSTSSNRSASRETTPKRGSNEHHHKDDEFANRIVEVPIVNDDPVASTSASRSAQAGAVVMVPGCSSEVQVSPDTLVETIVPTLENTESVSDLNDAILDILGVDPTQQNVFGADIQKELAIRLEHYACNGLTKEARKELKEKYMVPNNCKLINAPVLNAELKAVLSDVMANRDKAIEMKQSQLASALSALGQAMTRLFSSREKDAELLKILMDTSRILCDCQYSDSMRRRGFVLSCLKKDLKDPLQTTTKIDNYLFGQGFSETLKTAKAINKSSTELKAIPATKPTQNKKSTGISARPLNWKGPVQTRRQPEPQRTKEPAQTKYRQSNSSRPLQHRQQRNKRR